MEQTFRLRHNRWLAALFVFIVLIELPSVFDGGQGGRVSQGLASVIVVGSLWFAVRSWRSATVTAANDGVVYQSLFRTRRWTWDDIDRFELRNEAGGWLATRRILWIVLTSGSEHKLEELNESRHRKRDSEVGRIRDRLNDVVRSRTP